MPAPTRLARSPDGSTIAWTSSGKGSPAVVLTDGIGCAGWIWRRLAPDLARTRRVIHWNFRGHGRTPPPRDLDHSTIERAVEDLLAVLDAAGEERAVLAGHSMGVQVVLEAHRRAPDRVAALVLLCGAPGRLLDTFHDSGTLKAVFPYARRAFDLWPAFATRAFQAVVASEVLFEYALHFEANRALLRREDLERYFEDLRHVVPEAYVRLLESAAAHDASDHLPEIRVPTLVVAAERDGFTPMHLSLRMHEAIPGSEILVLPDGTHCGPLEHPELVSRRVRAFLAAACPVHRPPGRAPRRRAAPRAARPAAGAKAPLSERARARPVRRR